MKIKEQTRKLVAGCSKHCFEVVDETDEVSSKHCFEVVDRTDEVSNHTYGKATLTRFDFDFRRVWINPLHSMLELLWLRSWSVFSTISNWCHETNFVTLICNLKAMLGYIHIRELVRSLIFIKYTKKWTRQHSDFQKTILFTFAYDLIF